MKQKVLFLQSNKSKHLKVNLTKTGQEAKLLVVFVGRDTDKFELMTTSLHQAEHTQANTMVRGVLFDQAQADVSGMIKIGKDAQDTNAFLEEKILLVGDAASAKAKPMLEIEANEVKASHAATVGKIDAEQLFYLMSRGMSQEQAVQILVMGFLRSIIDKIKDREKRAEIEKEIEKKLRF